MNQALRQRGVAVNAPENQAVNSDQILVRRFFFVDTVTSVEVGGGDAVQGFRLATKFDLRIELRPGSEGLIFPPQLVLQYVPHSSLLPPSCECVCVCSALVKILSVSWPWSCCFMVSPLSCP
jgi:hypothetical protein